MTDRTAGMMQREFKVGDRIQLAGHAGKLATVKSERFADGCYLVEVDAPFHGGHTGGGAIPSGRGWFVIDEHVSPAPAEVGDA